MFNNKLLNRLFGTRHERERRRVQPIVDEIVQIEQRLASMSDEEIQGQTAKFRARLQERTGPIEKRIEELKRAKHNTADQTPSVRSWTTSFMARVRIRAPKVSCVRPSRKCLMSCCQKRSPLFVKRRVA